GQDFFKDRDHTLNFTTGTTASEDDRRKELARVFKVGLVSYAVETSVAPNLDVSFKHAGEETSASKLERDRWNYWVFRVGAGGNLSGELSSNNRSYRFNFSASRTTEQWKVNVSMFGNSNQSTFVVSDDLTVKSNSNGWNINTLVVKSIGPRW